MELNREQKIADLLEMTRIKSEKARETFFKDDSFVIKKYLPKPVVIVPESVEVLKPTGKLEFLDGYTLLIDKLPDYPEFKEEFTEPLDKKLSQLLLDSDNSILTPQMKEHFKNCVFNKLNQNGELKVIHNQRYNVGRFYPDNDGSIIVHSRQIKHTLFQYLGYKDIDQVKGHPTIIYELGRLNKDDFPNIKMYIDNFDKIAKKLIKYYSVKDDIPLNKDDIKYLYNMTIYGGSFKSWIESIEKGDPKKGYPSKKFATKKEDEFYPYFKSDIESFKQKIIKHNKALYNLVKDDKKTQWENENKLVSYVCGCIENHATYLAYLKGIDLGFIQSLKCGLEYDGLNLPPHSSVINDDEFIEIINDVMKNEMGIGITFKFKDYDKDNVIWDSIEKRNEMKIKDELENKLKKELETINKNTTKELEDKIMERKTKLQELITKKETVEKLIADNIEFDKNVNDKIAIMKSLEKETKTLEKEEKKLEKLHEAAFKKAQKERIEQLKKENSDKVKEKKNKKILIDGEFQARTDNDAGKYLFNKFKDILICCRGQLFLKVENVWMCDTDKIHKHLLEYVLNSKIYTPDNQPYAQNITDARHIKDALLVKIETNPDNVDLYEKFHSTTKGKLCFKDGVLDFIEKKFYLWEEINFEFYSCVMINRKYAEYFDNPDREIIDEIKNQIFEPLFGNDVNTALKFLARALAGHCEDKQWATYLGNRDCGKGVIYEILKFAFEDYVSTFELGNVLYQRNSSKNMEETSRMLYWLIDLQFTRLAISQETPPPSCGMKASGKMIKKMAGGGDTHVARRNYDRKDTHFKIDSTFLIMGNNELDVDTPDTMEHCIEFKSVTQFKTQEAINEMIANGDPELLYSSYKIKDSNIKSKSQTTKWCNAVVYLIFENYLMDAVPTLRDIIDDTEMPLRRKILTTFTITRNMENEMLVGDVENRIGDCKKKIKNELESMGIIRKQATKGDNRKKWCYYGIKLIENDA